MTYDEWYREWKKLFDEHIKAEQAVADYAAQHHVATMEEFAELHRLDQSANDLRRQRDELTERYKKSSTAQRMI